MKKKLDDYEIYRLILKGKLKSIAKFIDTMLDDEGEQVFRVEINRLVDDDYDDEELDTIVD